jgi:peptidoglycan/LPS O-acetylase OafA/YrhL
VGVTLFFVLSGFLITSLLLEERDAIGAVDLRRFYIRRVRRLGPALVAVMLSVVALRPVLGERWVAWPEALATACYVGNWVLTQPGHDLGGLTITWSLAIEEQFYVVWPLLVAALWRRRVILVLACVASAASLLLRWSLLAGGAPPERVYFGSDVVACALLVGASIAALRVGGAATRPSWAALLLGSFGVAAMASPLRFPTLAFGVPVATLSGALLVWACTGSRGVRPLEARWLRWFGERSYGLYLWHGVVLWAMTNHFGWSWPLLLAIGVPVSLLLAEGSFRWIEAPFRAPQGPDTGARVGATSKPEQESEQPVRIVQPLLGARDSSCPVEVLPTTNGT